MITGLNDKIVAALEEEDIEVEIPEPDEYIFSLELNSQQVKRLIQIRTSRLNVHVETFPSGQDPIGSKSIRMNAQSFIPQPPLVRSMIYSENESQVHAQESIRTMTLTSVSVEFHLSQIT